MEAQHEEVYIAMDAGLLFEESVFKKCVYTIRHIGIWGLLVYIITFHNPFRLTEKFNKYLQQVPSLNVDKDNKYLPTISGQGGETQPLVMCEYMKGGPVPALDIHKRVLTYFSRIITDPFELSVLRGMTYVTFQPQIAAAVLVPSFAGIDFLHTCVTAKMRNRLSHGTKPLIKIVTISNYNEEMWAALKQRYPQYLRLFDAHIVSGEVHMLKPDPAILRHAKQSIKSNVKWIFVDGKPENVGSARFVGMTPLLWGSSIAMRQFLQKRNIF